jgi:SMC interacting uncharacterized protein involved in chromosome segregation
MDESGELVNRSTLKEAVRKIQDNVAASIAASTNATGDLIDSRTGKLAGDIEQLESTIGKIKQQIDLSFEVINNHKITIEELETCDRKMHGTIEQNTVKIKVCMDRLDGVVEYGGTESIQIERLRTMLLSAIEQIAALKEELGSGSNRLRDITEGIASQLSGNGGQMGYIELRGSASKLNYLTQIVGGLGVTGVAGLTSFFLGVGKPVDLAPVIAELKTKIERQDDRYKAIEESNRELRSEVKASKEKLEDRINRVTDRSK